MRNRKQGQMFFTKKQLKQFNGRDGRPAYISFKGKLYDVSDSPHWIDGKHLGRHSAGDELTAHIMNAPHGEEVLTNLSVVGELNLEKSLRQRLVRRIERLHLHSMTVHFAIAYSIGASLLSLLYMFSGNVSHETASYYLLLLGFLGTLIAGFSGLFSWKVTFEGRMSKTYVQKIIFTVALIVVITVCFVWRTLDPNVLITRTYLSYIYLALTQSLTPTVTILGYYGGKIVFP